MDRVQPFRPVSPMIVVGWLVLLCNQPAAYGQFLNTSATVHLWAMHDDGHTGVLSWQAYKTENYSPPVVQSRLKNLATGTLIYANDHDNDFPDLASTLFTLGYVDDALSFYNPADWDDAPTTIGNDVPDAANSALISFDFPSAGGSTSDPPGNVMFTDNSTANNAGLGWNQAYVDGHTAFVPVWPHPFTDIYVPVNATSKTVIYRGPDGPQEPFAFDLPGDVLANVVAAPHSWHLLAEGSVGQEIIDVFASEGFDEMNICWLVATNRLTFEGAELLGPGGPAQLVTVYAQFDGVLTRTPADSLYSSYLAAYLLWSDSLGNTQRDHAQVSLTQFGLFTYGGVDLIEERILGPGDSGYVPGADTRYVRGIVQLSVDMDIASADGSLYFSATAVADQDVTAESVPGRFGRADVDFELPVTASIDQIKLYVPAGYDLSVPDLNGPGDVVKACQRGDHDLDGQVDATDRTEFEAAYTRPLVSVNHVPGTFEELQTFDFDGQGDIDCADYDAFVAAWTGGGSPAFFAACELDTDNDGVPDGDDDCPATPGGTLVDQRGCAQGDFDADGEVNLEDWPVFTDCMAGPYRRPTPTPPTSVPQCLNAFDFNDDNDVDLADYASFQQAMTPAAK